MDGNLPLTISNITASLAPAFACGFAVQQALQIMDPVVSKANITSKPGTSNVKQAVMGVTSLTFGLLIAGFGKVDIIEPLSKAAGGTPLTLPTWLAVSVNALIISAGTEGFNSLMKFLSYQKEAVKSDAAVKKADAAAKQVPQGNGALSLVNG